MRKVNGITELTEYEAYNEIDSRKLEIEKEDLSPEFMNVFKLFKISIKDENKRILDQITDENRQTEADENGIAELYPVTDITSLLVDMIEEVENEIEKEALQYFTIYKEEE